MTAAEPRVENALTKNLAQGDDEIWDGETGKLGEWVGEFEIETW